VIGLAQDLSWPVPVVYADIGPADEPGSQFAAQRSVPSGCSCRIRVTDLPSWDFCRGSFRLWHH
jgi:hypothetical protein